MTQQILVTAPGSAAEYTRTTTLTADHDISGDTIQVSLGSYTEPATWVAPSVDEAQSDPNTRVVQLLIDDTTPPGTYWLWAKLTDNPEVVPRRGAKIEVI